MTAFAATHMAACLHSTSFACKWPTKCALFMMEHHSRGLTACYSAAARLCIFKCITRHAHLSVRRLLDAQKLWRWTRKGHGSTCFEPQRSGHGGHNPKWHRWSGSTAAWRHRRGTRHLFAQRGGSAWACMASIFES